MKRYILYVNLIDSTFLSEDIEQLTAIQIFNNGTNRYLLNGLEEIGTAILSVLALHEEYSEYIPFAVEEIDIASGAPLPRRGRRRRRVGGEAA